MQDRTLKLLLLLIAVGLMLNAAASFYQALVPEALADSTSRIYIEGGKLEVTVQGGYGGLPISIEKPVRIEGSGSSFNPLYVEVNK
ncbi:MAG: hypothetical protein P9M14_00360 [Candidatus Alcyoniella australis]|nr:hypothetical protein [Candidatus Alcyoniella australis]